jgi:ribonuclease P protein component
MSELRFPKRMRLLRAAEFDRVFKARQSAARPWFILYGAANEVGAPRLGLTVSRKVGNAVERNRWKRLLREAFRLSQQKLPSLDFVVVARSPAPPSLDELRAALLEMASCIDTRIRAPRRQNGGADQ